MRRWVAIAVPLGDVLALLGPMLVLSVRPIALQLSFVLGSFVALRTHAGGLRLRPYLSQDIGGALGRLGAVTLVVMSASLYVGPPEHLISICTLSAALVLAVRALTYKLVRDARRRGVVWDRTLIVGAGAEGIRLARTLTEHPEFGLLPVGFLDTVHAPTLPLPIVGDPSQLETLVPALAADRVVVTFGAVRDADLVRILRVCQGLRAITYVVPRFFELGIASRDPGTDMVRGIPLVRLPRAIHQLSARIAKRLLDLLVGTLLLIASLPLMLLVAVAVHFSSPGPVLFRQKRVGQDGRLFELLKFRTMRSNDRSDTEWSGQHDALVTGVGGLLRRACLDELPQLLNVVRGDMSLVGPRPERPFFVDQFRLSVRGYEDRHRAPAGLTGWAQIHGLRGDTSIDERVVFDNLYIDQWSLWQDLLILVRTIGAVVRTGKG